MAANRGEGVFQNIKRRRMCIVRRIIVYFKREDIPFHNPGGSTHPMVVESFDDPSPVLRSCKDVSNVMLTLWQKREFYRGSYWRPSQFPLTLETKLVTLATK
ncbi:hypothetical protein AVEN_15668-1 [Araneus ventricosus]|uniref:Uncharacterized protein n=1 Tax=Araneus ventricosus TaxID=182803 RepID=A0A4Y2K525_ARAVE|nr:hypothetical protein AVEN_15668-1 [Araneus ventricosus]